MNANELMVGDYLRVNKDNICIPKGTIVRVTEIDSENALREKGLKGSAHCESVEDTYLSGGVWCDYLEPVPLTAEILEKNGFHYTNEHTLKGADTYILRLEQRGFDLKVTIKLNDYFALDSYDDRVYRLVEISTGKWYVHHLQHCLKLVGIKKEIEL